MHLILSLSISYPCLIKFHDFADNSHEGMKHQMMGATQGQKCMTLWISNMSPTLSHLLNDNCHQPCLILFTTSLKSMSSYDSSSCPSPPTRNPKMGGCYTHSTHYLSLYTHTHTHRAHTTSLSIHTHTHT